MRTDEEVYATHKGPCEECGSSDANQHYSDGHQWCFKCSTYTPPTGDKPVTRPVDLQPDTHRLDRYRQLWQAGKKCGVPERVITPEHGGYFGLVDTGTEYLFPYFNSVDPEPCGFKIRRKDAKQFSTVGDMKEAMLYGSNKVGSGMGKKRVLVTEGEFDAMAARQMVQGGMTVVSLSKGASSVKKDFKTSYDWLDGFEEIIVAFDADEAGQKAVADAADIFGGKLKVVKLDPSVGKDACDYLTSKQGAVFKDLCYAANPFTPAGVLSTDELWERLNRERPDAMGDYPWASLNALTYGFRPTELVTICAGSGLGKSSILREIVMHVKDNTDNKIGVLFMEESVERTAEGFMGVDLSTPVHLPTSYVKRGDEEYKRSFDRVFGDGQLSIMDASFDTGATVDQVVSRVRFMAKALDCKIIVLDHISILVSGGQYGDERRALDEIMTKLRTLTQDTGIVLFAVSHLKRPDGKGHEEGAATSVAQLRGSASIAQLSDFVIGLERNGQAEDETERNTTHMRVLKNRFSGITGPAGHLLYQPDTGRLVEYFPEEAQEEAL